MKYGVEYKVRLSLTGSQKMVSPNLSNQMGSLGAELGSWRYKVTKLAKKTSGSGNLNYKETPEDQAPTNKENIAKYEKDPFLEIREIWCEALSAFGPK